MTQPTIVADPPWPYSGTTGVNHDSRPIADELACFQRTWDHLGHGAIVSYTITVAPEASPRRTTIQGWPLPPIAYGAAKAPTCS